MGGVFGSTPSLDTGGGDVYRSVLKKIGGQYGDIYNQANGAYKGDDAAMRRAVDEYSRYLTDDPATNAYRAHQVGQAEAGASEAAQAAQAHLDQTLAERGVGGPGSSAATGGAASIAANLAANHTNVLAQNAWQNQLMRDRNLATNANLRSGLADTDFSRMTGALGQEAGINSGLLQDANQIAMARLQAQLQAQGQQAGFWGNLGSAGINAWGMAAKPSGSA